MSTIQKLVCSVMLLLSVIAVLVFSFMSLAAWSEAGYQCPDGSDCANATLAYSIFGTLDIISAAVFGLCFWLMLQGRLRKRMTN